MERICKKKKKTTWNMQKVLNQVEKDEGRELHGFFFRREESCNNEWIMCDSDKSYTTEKNNL